MNRHSRHAKTRRTRNKNRARRPDGARSAHIVAPGGEENRSSVNISGGIITTGGGNIVGGDEIHIDQIDITIQTPSDGMRSWLVSEPRLTWFPLSDAFEENGPNLFLLLRWDFRLVDTLYGREDDLQAILNWAQGGSTTATARLISGPGGAGKTRLAASAAGILQSKGWSAGFLDKRSDVGDPESAAKGRFLIVDYPEEQPQRTAAVLEELAEIKTAPYPVRVIFLSRRPFETWEREASILKGRLGRQELAALAPLTIEQGLLLIAEAARTFADHARRPAPDLGAAVEWLGMSEIHRMPLYATAAAIHAVLSPQEAFGLGGPELLRQLALRELGRVRNTSRALGLGEEGLERLLSLGVLANGLNEEAVRNLVGSRICGTEVTTDDVLSAIAKVPWWNRGRLMRLEPDLLAAAFLDRALFSSFPQVELNFQTGSSWRSSEIRRHLSIGSVEFCMTSIW